MPNSRSQVLPLLTTSDVYPSDIEAMPLTTIDDAADIVDQYEIQGYDFENLQTLDVISLEPARPPAPYAPSSTPKSWLDKFALQIRQARTAVGGPPQNADLADPLYSTRQAFATLPMDAEWLENFQQDLPTWFAITKEVGGLIKDFRDGVCDERIEEAELCQTTLTKYFQRSLEIDRFQQDLRWRLDNFQTAAQGFPPYVVWLVDGWIQTMRLLPLPLAASLAYWGVEQTVACTLEISKHAEDARTAEYAERQFKLLESWRRRKDLVASVMQTRQLLIAAGTFARETLEFGEAAGPYVGWAWQVLTSGLGDLTKAAAFAINVVKNATRAPASYAPPPAPAAAPTTAAPSTPTTAVPSASVAAPSKPPVESRPPAPATGQAFSESPGMRARPVTSASPRQQATDTRVDALIQAAQKLAEDAATLKQETTPRTVERQPAGTRRRVRR
jgi:hypothetical protein